MNTETQQCPHCGTLNEIGLSRCENCQTPLTAYGGQVTGLGEPNERLRERARLVNERPPVIGAMAGFHVFVALFWPLAATIGAFSERTTTNAEGTNYIAAATSSIGPIFMAALCIPLAVALCIVAWGAWTQQPWAWKASTGIAIGFILLMLMRVTAAPLNFLWLVLAGVLTFLWFQPRTKAWYGMD
jgi:hypothetical protein